MARRTPGDASARETSSEPESPPVSTTAQPAEPGPPSPVENPPSPVESPASPVESTKSPQESPTSVEALPIDETAPAPPEPAAIAVPSQCLTFLLAGEEYGIGILQIREIVEYETVTRVPTTPPWIRGVMNLRGTVVPVVDLAIKFGLRETEVTARTCIVIVEVDLEGETTLMGVMVDAVVRVLDLSPQDVEEPPAFGARVRVDYLLGVGKVDDQLVLVLDADKVLSVDELLEVAAVSEEDSALLSGEIPASGDGDAVAGSAAETAQDQSLEAAKP